MSGTPQKLGRLGAIAPAVALVFGLQVVGAQADVRAGSIVSRIPLGASMPHGGGTARAPRTRAVAPRTSSWPARGRARAGLLTIPAARAPATSTSEATSTSDATSTSGASPGGSTATSAEPTVTAPTAGGSPLAPPPTTGSPPAGTTPTAGGPPAGGRPTTGTDPEHPTGGGAGGVRLHRNGARPAGTHAHRPRIGPTPAATHGVAATKPVATEPVATEPVATEPVATQPAATPSAASQPQPTPPQPAALAPATPTPTGPAATSGAATPPVATSHVATSPVATPTVANLSGSVSIAPGPNLSSGFLQATAPSRVRRLLAGLALEADRLAAAGNRRAVLTPLRRELGSLIAAVRSLPPADPAARPLAARLKQLNRVLAHLRATDGAGIPSLGPQLIALRALTTQLMRAGDEAATSPQPAVSAADSADSVPLAPSSSFEDTTAGLAASVRSLHASFEQGNDSAPHRRLGAMPSTSQLVPVPAPSSQGGPSPGGAAAGLSGGIGTAGPPSIALVAVLALAVSILLSKAPRHGSRAVAIDSASPASRTPRLALVLALSERIPAFQQRTPLDGSRHRRRLTPSRHRTIDVGPRTTSGTGASTPTEEKVACLYGSSRASNIDACRPQRVR